LVVLFALTRESSGRRVDARPATGAGLRDADSTFPPARVKARRETTALEARLVEHPEHAGRAVRGM
jgi:hypothetical protein